MFQSMQPPKVFSLVYLKANLTVLTHLHNNVLMLIDLKVCNKEKKKNVYIN